METIVNFFFHSVDLLPVALARISAAFLIVPFLRKDFLTKMISVGVATGCILPVIETILPEEKGNAITLMILTLMVIKEVFIGLLIGYALCVPFWAAQIAGNLIDQQRGASNVLRRDSIIGAQSTPYGSMLYYLTVVIFFSCGGLKEIIAAIYESFSMWPINRFIPALDSSLVDFGCRLFEHQFRLGVLLGAPAVVICFIVDLGMGLMNRVTAQLNVYMLAMPIKSGMSTLMVLFLLFAFVFVVKRKLFPVGNILGMMEAVLN